MLTYSVALAIAMVIAAMFLNFFRMIRGPSLPDRVVALDTLSINTIALVMLFGISIDSSDYFVVALLIAMMGFVTTAAFCKFMLSGNVID
ncbi:MAG TPA: K+/H+ antiporter subunit F [Hyphomicrobiaceae bacterium]|jgi:multicomponent K+:H+ antiporter subunit F|nr:K+/H+ antiporter subunit F [Hyphomicrobiaceae bacterium]